MSRDEIISQIVKDNDYRKMCEQICFMEDAADDLYQEIVLIILEMTEERIQAIGDTCLKCFFYVVARNQYCSKNSAFHRKYRKEAIVLREHARDIAQAMQSSCIEQDFLDKVERAMKTVQWYDEGILSLYIEHGTLQKVSNLVGIPLKSIHHTVSSTRKILKKKIKRYE